MDTRQTPEEEIREKAPLEENETQKEGAGFEEVEGERKEVSADASLEEALPGEPAAADETASSPLPEEPARYDLSIRLTREEILSCLRRGLNRRASRGRLTAQTVLLLLMAAYCLVAYILSGAQSVTSLGIGIAAVAVCVLMLALPELSIRRLAKKQAEMDKCLRLRVYDHGIGFGDDEQFRFFKYGKCHAKAYEDMILFRFQDGLVAVPRRMENGEAWELIRDRMELAVEK